MSDARSEVQPEVRVVPCGDLDIEKHAALQRRVFGHLLEENGIDLDRLGPDVFAWKMRPPAGDGRVAMVERDGAILSTCSAYPVRLASGERRVGGWHLCDAATAEEARGQGLFHRVLATLGASVPADERPFAFPNGQSRGAFDRHGYHAAVEVPLWFRPVIGAPRPPDGLTPVERFDEEHDRFADRVAAGAGLAPLKDAAYLTWRYLAHPFFRYRCYELREGGALRGVLVLHRMEARGRVSLWVMELLAVDPAARRALAQAARWAGREEGCDVVLAMRRDRVPGSVRMPACFLPKTHVLMVDLRGDPPSTPWSVETGDWDTF